MPPIGWLDLWSLWQGRPARVAELLLALSLAILGVAILVVAGVRLRRAVRARASMRRAGAVELARLVAFERSVIAHSPFATIVTDADGTITSVNDAAARMLRHGPSALIGLETPLIVLDASQLEQRAAALSASLNERIEPGVAVLRALAERGPLRASEWELVRADGTRFHAALVVSALTTASGAFAGLLLIIHDITERKREAAQDSHRADHDALTGLPTRRLLADRLDAAIARARHEGGLVGVLMVDLDGFKQINDERGHTIGDEMLCAVADRLRAAVRTGDTVARIGGDEFVVVLSDLTSVADADRVAVQIERALGRPVLLGRELAPTKASVGICVYPDHGRSADELLRHADVAMYGAKRDGRHGHRNFVAGVGQPARAGATSRRPRPSGGRPAERTVAVPVIAESPKAA